MINAGGQGAAWELIGGSADLNPSTDTVLKDAGATSRAPANLATDRQGVSRRTMGLRRRNIFYGIREHAMGSITNGLVYHGGLRAFSATFLVFPTTCARRCAWPP